MAAKTATVTRVFASFSVSLVISPCLCLCPCSISPLARRPPLQCPSPSIPPGSKGLSSHRAEGPRPGHSEAAAAGEGKRHRTECLSPSSQGRAHLPGREEVRIGPWENSGPYLPFPLWSVGALPESILFKMVRAHFRKASSTFSPVRALVSRNISSGGQMLRRSGPQSVPIIHADPDLLPLILFLKRATFALNPSLHTHHSPALNALLPRYPPSSFFRAQLTHLLFQNFLPDLLGWVRCLLWTSKAPCASPSCEPMRAGPMAVFITVSPAPSSKPQIPHSPPISHVTRSHSKLRARIKTHIFLMAKSPLNLAMTSWKNVDRP